jgi:hypothetical protein
MSVPNRPEDDALAQRLIDELTAELEPDDARDLAAELARMVEMGLLAVDEGEDDLRVGVAEGAPPVTRPWPLASRRPDRWGGSPAPTSRRR